MSNPVIHFDIQADDINRVTNFYKNTLGWEITKIMSAENGPFDYYGLKTRKDGEPGIDGGLMKRGPESNSRSFEATVTVADIKKTLEDVKANGGTIVRDASELPGVGFMASVKDTEGNNFNILQPTEWQAK